MSTVIRLQVIKDYLKGGAMYYEYWYSKMNDAERRALCSYFKCQNSGERGCKVHNP